jgi:hypothetical protein
LSCECDAACDSADTACDSARAHASAGSATHSTTASGVYATETDALWGLLTWPQQGVGRAGVRADGTAAVPPGRDALAVLRRHTQLQLADTQVRTPCALLYR